MGAFKGFNGVVFNVRERDWKSWKPANYAEGIIYNNHNILEIDVRIFCGPLSPL